MWRIWMAFSSFAVGFLVILGRLFYWQMIAGDRLRSTAALQYSTAFRLPASRGEILASDGSPLVMNQQAFLVFGQPRLIKNVSEFSDRVASLLDRDPKELASMLSDTTRVWVALGHKIESHVAEELTKLGLPGLGMEQEPKRYYPEASMAAHLLGFVGSDERGVDRGYFGIEGYYDRELRGKDGQLEQERDAKGAPILIGEAKRIEAENGRDLVLWLDRSIEHIVERKLAEGVKKYGAKEGSVIIMDPKTGGIVALVAYPSYDPTDFVRFDKSLYKNPLVASSYEPGSTFKALVMAAALEEKLISPTTTMEEAGPLTIGEYTIRTWNNEYHGTITMTNVLERSSNVGMVFVAKKLGRDRFQSYLKNFGFGKPTDIDLEEEASPLLREDRVWPEIDLATASFGQGIAVTPIQMVRAVASLANDGWLMEPHVVKEIREGKGRVISVKPKRVKSVVSSATARIITEMMVSAVDNGEAKWAKPKGYRIAGKTGTAQIPVAGHYDEKKTIASFVGYAPADDPKFVMLVTLREPTSSPWGSETAAPLFFTISRDLFRYFGIPPQ